MPERKSTETLVADSSGIAGVAPGPEQHQQARPQRFNLL